MAKYAKLGTNNIVEKVYEVPNDIITDIYGAQQDDLGVQYLNSKLGFHPRWVRTYPSCEYRKNYAGIGFTYNAILDAFIPPKPDNINEYQWNNDENRWDIIT